MHRLLVALSLTACSSASVLPASSEATSPGLATTPPSPDEAAQPYPATAPTRPLELAASGRGAHMVRVPASEGAPAFWLDRTEASEFDVLLSAGEREGMWQSAVRKAPRDTALVSYEVAASHCRWAGKRLPTAEEWARAAGPGLKGTIEHAAVPVDAGAPNGFGLYGMDNHAIEWTSSRGEEPDHQRVGGLEAFVGNSLRREDTTLAFRCALDERFATPLPAATATLELVSSDGVCVRRGADRATYCRSIPGGYFAELAPDFTRGWSLESGLDAALQFSEGCALYSSLIACKDDDILYVRKTDGEPRFVARGGGVWLDNEHGYRLSLDAVARWYEGPKRGVAAFPVRHGFVELGPDGTAHYLVVGDSMDAQSRSPLTLPRGVSGVVDLGDTTCLRSGGALSCGKLDEEGYVEAARLSVPLKGAAIARSVYCLWLDDGALHCGVSPEPETVPIDALRALPPVTLRGVRELATGYLDICALTENGQLYCLPGDIKQELDSTGKRIGAVRLEPAPLPNPPGLREVVASARRRAT